MHQMSKKGRDKSDVDMLITKKTRGFLTYPSDALADLIRPLGRNILKTAVQSELEEYILFMVLEGLDNMSSVNNGM